MVDGRHLRAGAGELHPPVQLDHGVPKAQAYNTTMYIMAGRFVIGFICNFLIKAVNHALPLCVPNHEATLA